MTFDCKHCNNKFKNKYILQKHMTSAIFCLKLRGEYKLKFKCKDCDKDFSRKHHLSDHLKICKKIKFNSEIKQLLNKLDEKEHYINSLKLQVQILQDKLENIAIKAVQRPFGEEIYIDNDSDNDSVCEIEEYKLSSLDIGEGHTIEHRDEDGYINVTNLCKAGGKKFAEWKRLDKTIAFLGALSSTVQIHTVELIKHNTGGNGKRHTWVHPHVAINIAQWISPLFDVKVSAWVYEAMMTGKVDIANTKTYKEIRQENKTKDIRIRFLEKKYLRRHKRIEYKEKYVIYILTTRLMQKERRYIMGKATNLTNRLSTYNKSDEHRVVYYQGCGDEETMSLVENMVFHHLHKYREQANRERFILPENEEIILFSNWIKKSIEYCKKTDL
jgi:hypothetical protein